MTLREIKKALRAGKYAWPGGYPLYFITTEGEALSFEAVRKGWRNVVASVAGYAGGDSTWHITAIDTNWEDGALYCAESGERIESAYAEDDSADAGIYEPREG